MGKFSTIKLDELPLPDALEVLDIEQTVTDMKQYLTAELPELAPVLALESEPATKVVELLSYQITVLRQRINNAVKATMLAYATGTDLDHRGTDYNVTRLTLDEGDLNARPPRLPVFESDDDFRRRTQLALEGFSTAGPEGAYIFHALSAHGQVLDASATSPAAGKVNVYLLSRDGTGAPSAQVIDAVAAHLNHEDVRPLTDQVQVLAANIVNYSIRATIYFEEGPDKSVSLASASKNIHQYKAKQRKLGGDITLSGLYAALHVPGVARVTLNTPTADLIVDQLSAPNCTAIELIDGGVFYD